MPDEPRQESLVAALPQALEIMKTGAVLAVISFHSGEDRVVKQFLRDHGTEWLDTPKHPNTLSNPKTPKPRDSDERARLRN